MAIEFLDLPYEIRLLIYEFAMPTSKDHKADGRPGQTSEVAQAHAHAQLRSRWVALEPRTWSVEWRPGTCLALLATNRQVHQECSDVLYTRNSFEICIRYPKEPQLSMHNAQTDEKCFVGLSRKHSRLCPHNCHLCTKGMTLSKMRHHPGMAKVRKWHVNLPSFDHLIGVDRYMRVSSGASRNGINKWMNHRVENRGELRHEDVARMEYLKTFKTPVDEVAAFLRQIPSIQRLCLSFTLGKSRLFCLEYLVEQLYDLPRIRNIICFHSSQPDPTVVTRSSPYDHPNTSTIDDIQKRLQDKSDSESSRNDDRLTSDANEMLRLLHVIRNRQILRDEQSPIPS